MKIKTKATAFALAAAALLAAGCGHNEDTPSEVAKYITVNTSIGQMTRMATDADGSQRFEANDQISVYAWTGKATEVAVNNLVVNNSVNTYDGTAWTASPLMLWADPGTPHFFLGIYPAKAQIASAVTDFTADDYTLDTADQEASDLLVAVQTGDKEAGLTATANPVQLTFDHVMAKLIVNLNFRSQWGGTPTAVSVTAQDVATNAKVDYLHKAVAADDTSKKDIALPALATPQAGYALSYASIMVPQPGFSKITVTINGSDYTYTHSGEIKLEGGKYTTVNLTVGRDRIELGDVTVNDWQQGDVIDGGEAD